MSVNDRVIATAKKKRHDELCRAISKDLPTFIRVGSYLIELRELEVYKETHKSFEAFAFDQFGLERAQAYRLIDAAAVSANLSPIGDTFAFPKTESQYREVAKAPPEKQAEVVKKAAEKAAEENRKPTAKDYKQVVGELLYENGEPVSGGKEPVAPQPTKDEQAKLERKKARSYAEYLQRSIDDLNRIKRNPALHANLIKACGQILEGLEKW